MNKTISAQSQLREKLRNPAYTPAEGDLAGLWASLPKADEASEKAIVKALLRRDEAALRAGLDQNLIDDTSGAVAAALGRLSADLWKAEKIEGDLLRQAGERLLEVLTEAPENLPGVKASIRALGNLEEFDSGDALLSFWKSQNGAKHRQALIIALGKVGGVEALEVFERDGDSICQQSSLKAAHASALLLLKRRLNRGEKSEILASATVPGFAPTEVRFHCRAGLEQLLIDECPREWKPKMQKQGEVSISFSGSLGELFRVRTAESFGFPIRVTGAANSIEAVILALSHTTTRDLIKALTSGVPSYRIEWSDDGARRSVTRDVATQLTKLAPELVNETRQPVWQLAVRRRVQEIDIELFPRGLKDPRFAWRNETVPASSHAPLAAVLVRLSRPKDSDVVWDPFAGAGTELIERALAGKFKRLIGTDVSSTAIEVAKRNFAAAGLSSLASPALELVLGSFNNKVPSGVTKIVTNPPLGRRVEKGTAIELLSRFIPVAYDALAPGGILVWVTPDAAVTDKVAFSAGFKLLFHTDFDMGGFHAKIQALQKPVIDPT